MPQIIIRRSGGAGSRTAEVITEEKILVVVSDQQIEVYTGQDALDKTAKE